MTEKNTDLIEAKVRTFLRMYNIYNSNHNKNYSPKKRNIIKAMITSLEDPKAKVANRLSLSRIPLGLTIPLTASITKNSILTLSISSFYALSDFLDGLYSKHIIKYPTEGGTYLDAICDKIGAIELLIPAIIDNKGFIINSLLEGIIAKINTDSIEKGIDVKSTKLGKLKMWPLSMAIICNYMGKCGLNTKKIKIEKDTFNKCTKILIPITTILEIINIIEYYNLNKENEKKLTKVK